jgi:uncharacterized protein YbjT (DUF2867 family)
MNIILFGATGMVGQGVLRECLLAPDVQKILSIVRSATGQRDEKLHELILKDFWDFSDVEPELSGYDACFFCLGGTSSGMKEDDYRRMTFGITLAAAQTLVRLNPQITFVFVSGAGTDSTEQGRVMWARVKGKTENALLRLPFKAAYMFRPAGIQPLHGITSKTRSYRILYALTKPLLPLLTLFPKYMTTTEQIGRAMLEVARQGYSKQILESSDINAIGIHSI